MLVTQIYAGILCFCILFTETLCKVGEKCNSTAVIEDEPCLPFEECDDATHTCQCNSDYNNINGTCVTKPLSQTTPQYSSYVDNQGDGSLLAGILIPLFLITFVICSIYLNKRFELVKWLREKISQRNRNYDEFMIGQDDDDDPPLV